MGARRTQADQSERARVRLSEHGFRENVGLEKAKGGRWAWGRKERDTIEKKR